MNMRCLRGQTPFCVAAFAPRWKPLQLLTSAYFAVAHPDRGFAENVNSFQILVLLGFQIISTRFTQT